MAFVLFCFFFTHLHVRHTYTMYNNIVVYEQNNRHYNIFGNRSNNFYSNLYHLKYYVSIILLIKLSIYGGSKFHITQGRLPGRPGVV